MITKDQIKITKHNGKNETTTVIASFDISCEVTGLSNDLNGDIELMEQAESLAKQAIIKAIYGDLVQPVQHAKRFLRSNCRFYPSPVALGTLLADLDRIEKICQGENPLDQPSNKA